MCSKSRPKKVDPGGITKWHVTPESKDHKMALDRSPPLSQDGTLTHRKEWIASPLRKRNLKTIHTLLRSLSLGTCYTSTLYSSCSSPNSPSNHCLSCVSRRWRSVKLAEPRVLRVTICSLIDLFLVHPLVLPVFRKSLARHSITFVRTPEPRACGLSWEVC